MNKSKLAIFIDTIMSTIIIFIILFFWLRRFIKNAILILFVCIFISLLLFYLIFRYFLKKYKLNNLNKKQEHHLKLCLKFFKFSNQIKTSNFFEKLFSCKKIRDNLYENDNCIFYINFRFKLSAVDFFSALDFHFETNKHVVFICENSTDEFNSLLTTNKEFCDLFLMIDVYNLMKEKNLFPVENNNDKTLKHLIHERISIFILTISRKNFKHYFFSGLSILAFSFFVPYSIYYAIIGSVLLFLSIISLMSRNKNTLNTNLKLIDTTKNSTQ